MSLELKVNGGTHVVSSAPETPLLYVLTNELELRGPRFGCGLAQCGSCSILMDGVEVRSCVMTLASAAGKEITTLEGLPAFYAKYKKLKTVPELHPLQLAFIDEQAPQCGYCYNGMAIKGAELLKANPSPRDEDVRAAMAGHLCRCGTYSRIIASIKRAAVAMQRQP